MSRIAIVLATTFAFTATALAQGGGTPEDQRSCGASAKKFCARELPYGDFAVLGCLKTNRARIARSCQMVLVKYGQ